MRERRFYECSFCGEVFFDSNSCYFHEKTHRSPAELFDSTYDCARTCKGAPLYIDVKMNNGDIVRYTYSKEVKNNDRN